MRSRYPLAAVLLLVLTLVPLTGWPLGRVTAYAETVRGTHDSTSVRSWWHSLYTVVASNENEEKDKEDRREHGNNANDNNGNGNDDGDSNDNNDCCAPPPPPPARSAPPPPPPQNQASSCLSSGGSVSLGLSDGTVTMKVFQDNLNVEISKNDLPAAPGGLLGDLIFRVSASTCGGGGIGSLPGEGNLGVSYRDRVVSGKDESKFKLVYWDGQRWTDTPKQATDPGANYVSATIQALGVYALTSP